MQISVAMEASSKSTAMELTDMEANRRGPDTPGKGGTAGDDDEMTRMGKTQQFKVSIFQFEIL